MATGGRPVIDPALPHAILTPFVNAIDFILHPQPSPLSGGDVGGPQVVWDLTVTHLKVTFLALAMSLAVALPIGIYLGHRGTGELVAVGVGNAGRAVPELALIAFMAAAIGVGLLNLTIALAILGIPPILTNSFIGMQQVDRSAVEAARGVGMTEGEIITRVEVPLAVPTIMSGVRTAAINIVATATIAPLAGVLTLGDLILSRNVYGDEGVLAGAIVVALLAIIIEFSLAGLQSLMTSKGLKLQSA